MKYNCRTLKPKESEWHEVLAESPELAANEFHDQYEHEIDNISLFVDQGDGRYQIKFIQVEVDGYAPWTSRIYRYGIWRKGGVKLAPMQTFEQRLKAVAVAIGWEKDPSELLEEGWEGEETIEQATQRRYG